MTFVGRILVIVILAFSLFFLALSTVVMTASTNWKKQYEAQQKTNQELQQQVATAKDELAKREAALNEELQRRQAEITRLQNQIAQLTNERDMLQQETTTLRDQVETAQQTALATSQEAQARAAEAETLREQFQAAQQQANDYAAQQTQLDERIRVLERQLETAQTNNEDLRNALADYRNFLESRDLPSDPAQVRMATGGELAAPDVEGQVLRTSDRNDLIEFSLGSDDGIVAGQEFFVFRTDGNPQYIAKVKVTLTEADKSVARVISRYLGRKVQEGDHVAAKIQPRS